jgi:hypothetical protein
VDQAHLTAYAFGVALIVSSMVGFVALYEPNPVLSKILTAIIYLNGLLAIISNML